MTPHTEATIVDIKMPFGSMVVFMVKAALAAIPAAIILVLIYMAVAMLLASASLNLPQ